MTTGNLVKCRKKVKVYRAKNFNSGRCKKVIPIFGGNLMIQSGLHKFTLKKGVSLFLVPTLQVINAFFARYQFSNMFRHVESL